MDFSSDVMVQIKQMTGTGVKDPPKYKKRFERIELPAKLLDSFFWGNKSNINQEKPHVQMAQMAIWIVRCLLAQQGLLLNVYLSDGFRIS